MKPELATNRRGIDIAICCALILAIAGLYAQTSRFEFVNYDDGDYVTQNPHVKGGLTVSGIRWAFTTGHASNWHPLTWLSHMLDVQMYGMSAGGHHVTNVVLHAVNAVLLFAALRQLTGNRWGSALAAGLFALHPLRVESVAWVSERKDVLSTTFWLLTMLAYTAYAQTLRKGAYVLSLLFLALGLMCKPMLVTLPCVLLLLDYWPLNRTQLGWKRLVIEKLPHLLVVVASCVVTYMVQFSGQSVVLLDRMPVGARLGNAVVSVARYLGMFFYPAGLAAFYPHPITVPDAMPTIAAIVGAIALVLGGCMLAFAVRRCALWFTVGWLWYLGTLVPVIGIVQVGSQSHADRYTYIPMIGIALIAAWMIGRLPKSIAVSVGVLWLGVLLPVTFRQVGYWRDSKTLAERGVAVVRYSFSSQNNLGVVLEEEGRVDDAVECYKRTLSYRPFDPIALNNLGAIAAKRGERKLAIEYFSRAIQHERNYPGSYYGLGVVLTDEGRVPEAIAAYKRALQLNPRYGTALHNLALLLAKGNQLDEAAKYWEQCVEVLPDHVEARHGLGMALILRGKTRQGVAQLRATLALKPDHATSLVELARVLAADPLPENRNPAEALKLATAARDGVPTTRALDTLGMALAANGQFDQAIAATAQAGFQARKEGASRYAELLDKRIDLYRAGKPFVSDR